jgi:hypothetical protein
VPLGAIAAVAAIRLLPGTPPRPAGRLDLTGLVRLMLGVPALVFALAQAERTGSPTSLAALVPLATGVLLVGDFVRHALRAEHPLLDVRLYARRTFAAGTVSLFVFDIAWFGVLVLLPLYFQQTRGASPALAGLLLAPQGVGTVIGMWLSGRSRAAGTGPRLGVAGALVFAATTFCYAHGALADARWLLAPLLLVAGIGAGLAWVPATAESYADLTREEISHASPMVAVMVRLGASFGTAPRRDRLPDRVGRRRPTALAGTPPLRLPRHV